MKVKKVIFLDNGLVFAVDEFGEQMPEIQKQSWFRTIWPDQPVCAHHCPGRGWVSAACRLRSDHRPDSRSYLVRA